MLIHSFSWQLYHWYKTPSRNDSIMFRVLFDFIYQYALTRKKGKYIIRLRINQAASDSWEGYKTIIKGFEELGEQNCSLTVHSTLEVKFSSNNKVDYSNSGRDSNLLHLITSGERHYIIDNKETTFKNGSVIFIPAGTRYLTKNIEKCSGIGICFTFHNIKFAQGIYSEWSDERGEYTRLFNKINESMIASPNAHLHHLTLFYRILDKMTGEVSKSKHYAKLLTPAINMIEEHFRENLPVKDYAAACNLSESYFRRIFSEQIGMSPIEFRNSIRFNEARMLKKLGLSVSEIADLCGFCDAAYLRRIFKRDTGESLHNCSGTEIV